MAGRGGAVQAGGVLAGPRRNVDAIDHLGGEEVGDGVPDRGIGGQGRHRLDVPVGVEELAAHQPGGDG
jgi:hypothetical protein